MTDIKEGRCVYGKNRILRLVGGIGSIHADILFKAAAYLCVNTPGNANWTRRTDTAALFRRHSRVFAGDESLQHNAGRFARPAGCGTYDSDTFFAVGQRTCFFVKK